MPSKYTTVGLIIGVLSLFIGVGSWVFSNNGYEAGNDLKEEVKKAFSEIRTADEKEDRYVKRYLKERIAEIEQVKLVNKDGVPLAEVYYYSYWYKLTSTFRASVEIRHITDLNKKYGEEEGWGKASVIQHTDNYDHTIYLGETKFVKIRNLLKGEVYEVRMVDFNYDSDEPPTLPFRFKSI